MPKSLADGHMKFTILTEKPEDPKAPTASELNEGLDFSCDVLSSDFSWTAADSDKLAEKALCSSNNANALGASNFSAGITVFRYFDDETGQPDETEDAKFAAVQEKGTTVWGYLRKTGQEYDEDWADDDEIALGMEVITDTPQQPSDQGGYIKYRIPMEPQRGYPFIKVGGGGSTPPPDTEPG